MQLEMILKALADETRLRIINLLKEGSLCCMEMLYALENVKQSNFSRHMSKLSGAGLVTKEKKAQWINYSLNHEVIDEYSFLLELIKKEFVKNEIFVGDSERLKECKKQGISCEEGGCDEVH